MTERVHDNSWSATLELSHRAEDRSLLLAQDEDAVDHAAPGNHVNLATHGEHGHPETHLYTRLDEVAYEYVERCGGHVTRVHVE